MRTSMNCHWPLRAPDNLKGRSMRRKLKGGQVRVSNQSHGDVLRTWLARSSQQGRPHRYSLNLIR